MPAKVCADCQHPDVIYASCAACGSCPHECPHLGIIITETGAAEISGYERTTSGGMMHQMPAPFDGEADA